MSPSSDNDRPSGERRERRQIYLPNPTAALLDSLASSHHDGNVSATIAAAVPVYLEYLHARRTALRQALLDRWEATAPTEQVDPADDTRAEQSHLVLAELLGEEDARAIGEVLTAIRAEFLAQGMV